MPVNTREMGCHWLTTTADTNKHVPSNGRGGAVASATHATLQTSNFCRNFANVAIYGILIHASPASTTTLTFNGRNSGDTAFDQDAFVVNLPVSIASGTFVTLGAAGVGMIYGTGNGGQVGGFTVTPSIATLLASIFFRQVRA